MKLSNRNGDAFELIISHYQYPDNADSKYDSNWPEVHMNATLAGRSWSADSPCLLTWEVKYFAEWLAKIDRGEPVFSERRDFEESVLAFQLISNQGEERKLRVYLKCDARPPWNSSGFADDEDVWIDFPLSEIDLKVATNSLILYLREFPIRAKHLLSKVRVRRV